MCFSILKCSEAVKTMFLCLQERLWEDVKYGRALYLFNGVHLFHTVQNERKVGQWSAVSLASGPVWLLRIGTDKSKHCMNYAMVLAFVITSLLSPLSFCLWISTLSAPQESEETGEKKEEKWLCKGFKTWYESNFFLLFKILAYLWSITIGANHLMLFAESTHCSHQAYKSWRHRHVIVTSQLKGQAAWSKWDSAFVRAQHN